jgi:putative transposase
MIINKAYKFRLYPTKEQVAMLRQHGGNVRFVWNKILQYANTTKEELGKYPTQNDYQKHIIQLKKENEFIKETHSQPIQVNAMRLSNTFARAFKPEVIAERNKKIAKANEIKDIKKKEKALAKALNFGFPKFKSKNKCSDSIFYPQNFIVKKSRIFLPKLKWINYTKHTEIEGTQKSVTITQDGNQYYISITVELEIKDKPKVSLDQANKGEAANIVGIDVGLKNFATLSDGTIIKNPRTLKKYLKKLRRANKKLDRQELKEIGQKTCFGKEIKKSSNNRNKQVIEIQRVYRKIRNIRKDFLHKTSYHIITKYDGVILEDLDIKEMLKKNGKAMNRSISDVSWYEFGRMLNYKSEWYSKYFCQVSQYFPSTQKCSKCDGIAYLSLKDREYICPSCGARMDRDLNAAINIKNEGIKILVNTVATTGIKACGPTAIAVGLKQEKRRFRKSARVCA